MLRKLTSQNEFKISIWLYNVEGFIKLFKCRFIIGTLKTLYIAPLIIFDLYLNGFSWQRVKLESVAGSAIQANGKLTLEADLSSGGLFTALHPGEFFGGYVSKIWLL